jgi:hypothetical protein
MLVLAENLPIGLLQRAEQAPFAAGLVIVTHPIVMAIPHGSVSKKRISPPENAEIVCRRGLVARFNRKLLTCPKANGCRRQKRQCHKNRAPFHSSVRLEPGQASACPSN